MPRKSKVFSTLMLAVLVSSAVGLLSSCDDNDGNQDLTTLINTTSQLRQEADRQAQIVPYREQQYVALKSYFAKIAEIGLALKDNPQAAKSFSDAISRQDMGSACAAVFMSKAAWQEIMDRCSKNRFFLCAEEVRAYPEVVSFVRERLTVDLQQRFDQTSACSAALK